MTVTNLVFGIDALDPTLLDRWREDLPELAAIGDNGHTTRLESTVPTVTGVAWPSLATGKLPTGHGVTHFTEDDRVVNRDTVQSKMLWQLADEDGQTACTAGMPATYPPDETDGIVVSGIFTPSDADDWVHPPELATELPDPTFDTGRADEETLLDAVETRKEMSLALLERDDWDLFVTTFMETDRAGHSLLRPQPDGTLAGYDDLKEVYVAVDEAVGEIRAAADERNVFVVSDHGFGRHPRQRINVLQWLAEEGHVAGDADDDDVPGVLSKEGVESVLNRTPILDYLPASVRRFGRSILPSRRVSSEEMDDDGEISYSEFWLHGGFTVPDGAETSVEELLSDLRAAENPTTGEPLFSWVARTDEAFDGPYTDRLPDVLVRFPPDFRGQPMYGDSLIEPIPTNAVEVDHDMHGVFLAAGSDITAGGDDWTETFHICDVTPTLLHLLGTAVPADCDGTARIELFTAESDAGQRSVESGPPSAMDRSGSEDDDEEVRERLADLGYID